MIREHVYPAIVVVTLLTVLTGVIFPATVWVIGQVCFPHEANGSMLARNGEIIGSALIGQRFHLPQYFHPRPSAAGAGYDALSSGGTNLGPTSKKLFLGVADDPNTPSDETFMGVANLAAAYREENLLSPETPIPVDAVTRSGSGLDPEISPANAQLQLRRVARARNATEADIQRILDRATKERPLGLVGERRVSVLKLNLALDAEFGRP